MTYICFEIAVFLRGFGRSGRSPRRKGLSMIVISKTFTLPAQPDFSMIGPLKDIVFIDIETTGLSPASSSVYLIGAVYHRQMEWHIRQWFSDSLVSEQEILKEFITFLSDFRIIVSYNGEAFDLSFLRRCAEQYSVSTDCFDRLTSFDILKKIRPLKSLLGLPDLKQRTVEAFLGVDREDKRTGGELIDIYKEYLETRSEELYTTLLQHNEWDLKCLPQIVPILSYQAIFSSEWTMAGHSLNQESGSFTAIIDCGVKVPVSCSCRLDRCSISLRGNQIIVELTAYHGSLKYFFDDYKDYYYLPQEDRAIHKKVGQYVDTEFREQATAANCYTHKEGFFLPIRSEGMFDVYRSDYRSKELYTEYLDDDEFLLAVLTNLIGNKEA